VVTTWIRGCLQTGKPSGYITNHEGQLCIHFLGLGKSSLLGLQQGPFICVVKLLHPYQNTNKELRFKLNQS